MWKIQAIYLAKKNLGAKHKNQPVTGKLLEMAE